MRRKTIFTVLVILMAGSPFVQAQDGGNGGFNYNNELSQRASIPQSPEAAAFTRFGDVGVSMYTGTPNVSVPMYTHQGRELNLPINLSYDASGIKVNQRSTLTGLGWNLQVGGRISRQVNGLPDDFFSQSSGPYTSWYDSSVATDMIEYSKNEYRFDEGNGGSKTYTGPNAVQDAKDYLSFLRDVHEQHLETQPDYYNLNVMGLNETFVLDLNSKEPFSLTNPNTRITRSTLNGDGIQVFTVTSDNGTTYTFQATEHTKITKNNDTGTHHAQGTIVYYYSSWYLTKIESPLRKDIYEFEYELYTDNRTREYTPVVSEVSTIIADLVADRNTITSYNSRTTDIYNKKYVRKIKHNGKVIAEVTIANDFGGGPDAAIDKIEIYSDGNDTSGITLAKVFDLNYSYFTTSQGLNPATAGDEQVRLKLDEVVIQDDDENIVYSYEFDYDSEDGIASLTSNAQDYLGFYNGFDSNPGLIRSSSNPTTSYPYSYGYQFSGSSSGANRNPVFTHAKKGTLTKIKYPTGGYSEFEYEGATEKVPSESTVSTQLSKASLNISATNDASFDPNACNKVIGGNEYSANEISQNFTIGDDGIGIHHITYTRSGTPSQSGLFSTIKDFVLIKTPDNLTTYLWNQIFDNDCNFLLDPSDLVYSSDGNYSQLNDSFYLDEGNYQLVLLLYDYGYSKVIDIVGPHSSVVTEYDEYDRAGIRVKNIIDYTETGIKAKEREFIYNSTIAITHPTFEYITEERYRDNSTVGRNTQNKNYDVLHRVAFPLNGDKAHIVYPNVTEAVIDFTNPSNTLTKTTRYKVPSLSDGTYGSGSYTVPLYGGTFSSTNYSKNPSLGQMRGSSTSTSSSVNTFNNDAIYYSTFGIALGTIGRNNNYFPAIELRPNSTNEYYINLRLGNLLPFFNSVILGGGDGNFDAVAPIECNGDVNCTPEIARLFVHKTNAYGRFAGDINTSQSITDGVVKSTTYQYTNGIHRYVKSMVTQGTGSNPQKTVYTYPFEVFEVTSTDPNNEECYTILSDGTIIQFCDTSANPNGIYTYPQLVNANMVNQPVLVQQYDGIGSAEKLISKVLTSYSGVLPQTIFTSRTENEDFEPRMTFEQYENNNLVQARQTDGTPVSFIWGYDNRYVVAKISNITYDSLPSQIVADIKTYSDTGNQSALLNSLETLQNDAALANSMMTYYTYTPNIGVTTMTDETGYRMQYFYDDLQRLDRVEDQQGNVLSQNKYNYKN